MGIDKGTKIYAKSQHCSQEEMCGPMRTYKRFNAVQEGFPEGVTIK